MIKKIKTAIVSSALLSFGAFSFGLPGNIPIPFGGQNSAGLGLLGGGSQQSGGEAAYQLMSVEADLMIFNEAAYILKLNQLVLERLPVTLEDKWPEYLAKMPDNDKYESELLSILSKDFPFYKRINDYRIQTILHAASGKAEWIKSAINLFQSGIIDYVGKRLENEKLIVFYKYPACEVGSWKTVYSEKGVNLTEACSISKPDCDKYRINAEKLVVESALKNGIENWLELKIEDKCLRPVYGYWVRTTTFSKEEVSAHPSSFKNAFLEVLPRAYVKEWKENFEKYEMLKSQYDRKKAEKKRLEEEIKQNPSKASELNQQLAAIDKELKELEGELKGAEAAVDKVMNEALQSVELDERKLQLAKKLYLIAKYVDDTLNKEVVLVTATLPKFFYDAFLFIKTVSSGNLAGLTPQDVAKAKDLAKNIMAFLPNIIGIYSGISTQKAIVDKYYNYLKAVAQIEGK